MITKLVSRRKTKANHYLAFFAKDIQNGVTYFYWARTNRGDIIWARMQTEDQITEQIIIDKEIPAERLPLEFMNFIHHNCHYEAKKYETK